MHWTLRNHVAQVRQGLAQLSPLALSLLHPKPWMQSVYGPKALWSRRWYALVKLQEPWMQRWQALIITLCNTMDRMTSAYLIVEGMLKKSPFVAFGALPDSLVLRLGPHIRQEMGRWSTALATTMLPQQVECSPLASSIPRWLKDPMKCNHPYEMDKKYSAGKRGLFRRCHMCGALWKKEGLDWIEQEPTPGKRQPPSHVSAGSPSALRLQEPTSSIAYPPIKSFPPPFLDLKKMSPICTACKEPLYIKFQQQDNTPFWGCRMYPDCRTTMIIDYTQMPDMIYYLRVAISIMEGWMYPDDATDLAYQAYRLASNPWGKWPPSCLWPSAGSSSDVAVQAMPHSLAGCKPPRACEDVPIYEVGSSGEEEDEAESCRQWMLENVDYDHID